MQQAAEKPSAVGAADFLPINGTDFVEFYVGNARQAAHYYRSAFGMKLAGYSGPETGTRDRASYLVEQNKIRFVLTTALAPDHPVAAHVALHGDGSAAARRSWSPGQFATTTARSASPRSLPTETRSTRSSSAGTTVAPSCPATSL